LTIALDHVSIDSCKTHVCEHTFVTGLFDRLARAQVGGGIPRTARVRGMLARRGVSLYRFDRESGHDVWMLSGDVSIDGSTFSGTEECGEFSLAKKHPVVGGGELPNQPLQSDRAAARALD
jgi:hypothetical protein